MIQLSHSRFTAALALVLFLLAGPASALGREAGEAEQGRAVPLSCPDAKMGPAIPPAPDRSQAPIVVYARELDASKTTQGRVSGEVEVFRLDQHLETDRIYYDPVGEIVTVPGVVNYEDQQVWLSGQEGRYSFQDESGEFSLIDYGLTSSSAHGRADKVELIGGDTSKLYAMDYTSCPGEKPDWQLYARELVLKHEVGRGEARDARLIFKGIPVLYAPYFTFPIDDRRKTGFLYPHIGQSSDTGLELGIPWYWNIAPNQDMTLEPRYLSKRGLMLSGQYRFLTRRTNGSVNFDFMPHDRKTKDERFHYLVEHRAYPSRRWQSLIIVDRVSDKQYYQDFGSNLEETSRQFLRSSGTLTGVGRYWDFEFMIDDFQILDEAITPGNEPYRRLPRMGYWMDRPLGRSGLYFGLDSELVHFDRDLGVTGTRLDLYPRFYWNRYSSWGFFKPSLGVRFTGYDLDRQGLPGDESPQRSNLIASLDAGLVFDRTTAKGDMQTIEPRLFYLYVPYENQDDMPVFDTGEFTFGYSQLFNTNRFAGGDRQGDTNQLSLAVTTNHFDGQTGEALWSLSLGQIIYFEDRRVRLADDLPALDEDVSPFLAEFTWHLWSRFSAVGGLQWNWDKSNVDVGTIGFNYRGTKGERARFEYRFRRDRVDQFDLRFFWPVNERWRILSRVNYSFADSDLLEVQGGLEYESCCWALRTVVRRYLRNREGDYRNGIYFELNLKGLTSVGTQRQKLFYD